MVRTERGIRGGNKRNVDREQGGRRERDGETEEGRARGRSNRSKGEGEREGRRGAEGTGVCGARSAGRGARDQWAAPGARASSSRRPCSAGSGSGRGSRGLGCAPAGCARQERQAPRSGAFVLCRGKQAARPGAGLALAPPLGHRGLGGLATRETGPLSPLLSRAGLRDRRSRRGAEKRRGGWGGERGRPGHGF